MPMRLAADRQMRRARLAWYALGAAVVTVLLQRSATFIPAPSQLPRSGLANEGNSAEAAMMVATTGGLMLPGEAWAKGGEWGPLEGKASSLVHPVSEGLFFLVTLYTGFLGWQWRQARVVGMEIADLRKQLPKPPPKKVKVEGMDDEHHEDDAPVEIPAAVKELQAQIAQLTNERKELIQGQYKDKHYTLSATLLGGGIFITFYGAFNTWFRAGKLFPGPHLFAGCAIVVLWAIAAACVPAMEKGNEIARNAHIAINVLILGLFAWQLPTGWEILMKVWGNAKLPWF